MFELSTTIVIQQSGPRILPWVVDTIVEAGKSVQIVDFSSGRKSAQTHPSVSDCIPISRSIDSLIHQVREKEPKDYLVLAGAEYLIDSFEGKEAIVRQFSELNLRLWEEGQRAWSTLVPMLGTLRKAMETSRLVVIIYAGDEAESIIRETVQDDESVEVMYLKSVDDTALRAQKELLSAIKTLDLGETLKEIEAKEEVLPQFELERFRAFAYLRHGGRSKAIEHLEVIIPNLSPDDRLLLAELYGSISKWSAAFEISSSLFDDNPFELGVTKMLLKSLLGALRAGEPLDFCKDRDVLKMIDAIVLVDNENIEVLELAADLLNRLRKYNEAARLRRLLWNRTEDPVHELLARFLDLEGAPLSESRLAEQYVLEWMNTYPSIRDQAYYGLGAHLRRHYNSSYKAFEYWSKVSRSPGSLSAYDAAAGRMMLLEDNIVAMKVLRLKDNDIGREKLIARKTNELLQNMELLSTKDKGYLVWDDFIDKAYTAQTWKIALTQPLLEEIKKWNETATEALVSKSYLTKVSQEGRASLDIEELSPMAAVHLLRKMKVQELQSIGQPAEAIAVIQGCLVQVDIVGTELQKVWARYEAAVLWSLHGRDQDAINQALSLFSLANRSVSPATSRTARMLAFLALANVHYRLGQSVTGIACLLVGMRISRELGELGAVIEEGRNLIHRFLLDEALIPTLAPQDRLATQSFFQKFSHGMTSLASSVRDALLVHDFERVYTILRDTVYAQGDHDREWAVHLTNFINACGQTERIPEGRTLILRHADEAIQLLSLRQDRLPNLLMGWSQFLIHFSGEENQAIECLRLARRLLRAGVEAAKERRDSLHYRSERSHIAELHRDLTVQYVEVLAFVHKVTGFSPEESESALQDLLTYLPLVNPRSLLENRRNSDTISDELVALEKEYLATFNEIAALDGTDAHKETLVLKYNKLQEELVGRHPNYRALPTLPEYPISDKQHVLQDNEVFVQYVVTRHGMVTLAMTRNGHNVSLALMPTDEYRERIRLLGRALQSMDMPTSGQSDDLRSFCAQLSRPVIEPLLQAIAQLPGEGLDCTVYVCPDLSLEMFSTNLLALDDSWLLEKTGRLVTVLDFEQVVEKPNRQSDGRHLRTLVSTLGSEADAPVNKARAKILTWADRSHLSYTDLKNNGDEIGTLIRECRQLVPDVLVMIGHGLPDGSVSRLNGATGILGFKHTILGDDLRRLGGEAEHLVLLTCSSGAPYQGQVESSTGVWSAALSENFFGVVLCRWDVNVNATLALLDHMLSAQEARPLSLSEALALAQREMLRTPTWAHPYYWAALEYWGY